MVVAETKIVGRGNRIGEVVPSIAKLPRVHRWIFDLCRSEDEELGPRMVVRLDWNSVSVDQG